jgi:hypothetical protein
MDYFTGAFGRSLGELTIEDIERFFCDERSETDQIEFKSISAKGTIDEKFQGIQKSVCAFLNSSGGLIIWGAPRGEKIPGRKGKAFKGTLTFFDKVLEKDTVVSKISDAIIPLPGSVRVRVLTQDEQSIAVIEVDQSEYSPHQTDNTYYMRIDGQSKPAPHHYIEALFKRVRYPNLEAYLKLTGLSFSAGGYKIDFNLFFFNWSPLQNEEQLSFRVIPEHGTFHDWSHPTRQRRYRNKGKEFFKEVAKDIFHFGEPVSVSDSIVFDKQGINLNGGKASVVVTFGGRYSPRKTSEYLLDFEEAVFDEPDTIKVLRKENRLTKDVLDEQGVNKTASFAS